jgi:hypothetical protein
LDVSRHTEADRIFTIGNTPGLTYREIAALNHALKRLILQRVPARTAKDLVVQAIGRGLYAIDLPFCSLERIAGGD